jgi:biopolymer transport protein ExbB/TolQ
MNKASGFVQSFFQSPILWGGVLAVGFYGLIFGGPLDFPLVHRYFTKHPVEIMETALFFIGLAAILLKFWEFHAQAANAAENVWGGIATSGSISENLHALQARLDELPTGRKNDYLIRRLQGAIDSVRFRGNAESLDDELKYLADKDAEHIHAAFGLFRVIIWAIPILGFLGTVVGITMALNGITDSALGENVMAQVLSGLGLKFDTTALALTLSVVLMFVYFFVEIAAQSCQSQIERRAQQELMGRFPALAKGPDGQVAAVRQMAETVVKAAEKLVRQQVDLWQGSMESAAGRWLQLAKSAGDTLQTGMAGALKESVVAHAKELAAVEQAAMQQSRNSWEKTLQSQSQTIHNAAALQEAVTRQVEVMERTVQAVGDVARLEDALNRNLSTLAGAKHFEQTIASMAAAINLLNAKLSEVPAASQPVKLVEPHRRNPSHAA